MRTHRIALMGGDGIGPEVVEAGRQVLDAASRAEGGFEFRFESFDWGSAYYRRTGRMMPEDGLAQLAPFDAI
jgi:tartrate dehydrogenase/decarboxylase / D-malate dehydrogenase